MSINSNNAVASSETGSSSTSSTKTNLLDAAEALFEESGVRATSLRAITERAQANIASVNYHFGSKTDLVRAVLARRIDPLNAERLRLLDEIEARPSFTLEEVLFALIAPAVRHTDGSRGLRLLSRMHFEPNPEFHEVVHRSFAEIQRRFFAAIKKTTPEVSVATLHWRLTFVVGSMAATVANLGLLKVHPIPVHMLPPGTPDSKTLADPDKVTEQLVRFVAGGLMAAEGADDTSTTK